MRIFIAASILLLVGCTPKAVDPVPSPGSMVGSAVVSVDFANVRILFQPPSPPYPEKARLEKISGNVVVEITIDPTGVPTKAKAISGPEELREVSESYAMNWRFGPVLLHGTPQFARFRLTMPFRVR